MKRIIIAVLCAFTASAGIFAGKAEAYNGGTFTCFFEVLSKKTWPKVEKLPPFTFDAMAFFSEAFQSPSLENRLIVAYYPGFSKPKELYQFALDLKYNGANSGADTIAVNGYTYTIKVGRDDSDLIGGFLHCKADLRE